jgi:hypothetical protein
MVRFVIAALLLVQAHAFGFGAVTDCSVAGSVCKTVPLDVVKVSSFSMGSELSFRMSNPTDSLPKYTLEYQVEHTLNLDQCGEAAPWENVIQFQVPAARRHLASATESVEKRVDLPVPALVEKITQNAKIQLKLELTGKVTVSGGDVILDIELKADLCAKLVLKPFSSSGAFKTVMETVSDGASLFGKCDVSAMATAAAAAASTATTQIPISTCSSTAFQEMNDMLCKPCATYNEMATYWTDWSSCDEYGTNDCCNGGDSWSTVGWCDSKCYFLCEYKIEPMPTTKSIQFRTSMGPTPPLTPRPTPRPTSPTLSPTLFPTDSPTLPTPFPTLFPTLSPTRGPTKMLDATCGGPTTETTCDCGDSWGTCPCSCMSSYISCCCAIETTSTGCFDITSSVTVSGFTSANEFTENHQLAFRKSIAHYAQVAWDKVEISEIKEPSVRVAYRQLSQSSGLVVEYNIKGVASHQQAEVTQNVDTIQYNLDDFESIFEEEISKTGAEIPIGMDITDANSARKREHIPVLSGVPSSIPGPAVVAAVAIAVAFSARASGI